MNHAAFRTIATTVIDRLEVRQYTEWNREFWSSFWRQLLWCTASVARRKKERKKERKHIYFYKLL